MPLTAIKRIGMAMFFSGPKKNHRMQGEYWVGYRRHNELYRQVFDLDGSLIREEFMFKNDALMMYSPFIEEKV